MNCTCGGTIFTDSLCYHCATAARNAVIAKMEKVQEKITEWEDRFSELESDLEQIDWRIEQLEEEESA